MPYTDSSMVPDSVTSDEQLLADYNASDLSDALAHIIKRHSNMVYATCMRTVGDPGKTEDAVQATYLLFVRKAKSLPANTVLSVWLYCAARNCARTMWREETRRRKREEQVAHLSSQRVTRSRPVELGPELDDALQALPAVQRDAVIMRFICGFSEQESAQILKCPKRTLHTRVGRALRRMRQYLGQRGTVMSTAMLVGFLSESSIQIVQPDLIAHLISVCAGQAAASGDALSAAASAGKIMAFTKIKAIVLTALIAISIGVPTIFLASHTLQSPALQVSDPVNPEEAEPIVKLSKVAPRSTPDIRRATLFSKEFDILAANEQTPNKLVRLNLPEGEVTALASLPYPAAKRSAQWAPDSSLSLYHTPAKGKEAGCLYLLPRGLEIRIRIKSERAGVVGLSQGPSRLRFNNEHFYTGDLPVNTEWRDVVIRLKDLRPYRSQTEGISRNPVAGVEIEGFAIHGFNTGAFWVDRFTVTSADVMGKEEKKNRGNQ